MLCYRLSNFICLWYVFHHAIVSAISNCCSDSSQALCICNAFFASMTLKRGIPLPQSKWFQRKRSSPVRLLPWQKTLCFRYPSSKMWLAGCFLVRGVICVRELSTWQLNLARRKVKSIHMSADVAVNWSFRFGRPWHLWFLMVSTMASRNLSLWAPRDNPTRGNWGLTLRTFESHWTEVPLFTKKIIWVTSNAKIQG